MSHEHRTEVLVVGAGAAGMYAAVEAARRGASVTLLDKSMVGRGGATIMAQMTVAAALGHAEPDSWVEHYVDTVASGRGITNEPLAALTCYDGPERILESRGFGINWAANGDGDLEQILAPGHSRARCCYVGSLQTGSGVSRGLRKQLRRQAVETFDGMLVTRLIRDGRGAVVGAVAFDREAGDSITFWATAVVLAGGGLTELYARNSASINMTGDAYALALDAGAALVDMEMVQFFPIANLAPRTVGIDPIMWDPFRYKLGGRLLNGDGDEFVERYAGTADEGTYSATRDVVTYGILKEVAAGRGSPAGGAYLDFTHLDAETIRTAFPTAIDRLLDQGIDISERAVEVAPTAHYTIGGIQVDIDMATRVTGLYAAGEAVGGMHGANRLSGNAITEALVFGAQAGASAAHHVTGAATGPDATARGAAGEAHARLRSIRGRNPDSTVFLPALRSRLKQVMWEDVGPVRTGAGLELAAEQLRDIERHLPQARVDDRRVFNLEWQECLELEGMLRTAEAVRLAATVREESRGAHQRDDFPAQDDRYERNTVVTGDGSRLRVGWAEPRRLGVEAAAWTPPRVREERRCV